MIFLSQVDTPEDEGNSIYMYIHRSSKMFQHVWDTTGKIKLNTNNAEYTCVFCSILAQTRLRKFKANWAA